MRLIITILTFLISFSLNAQLVVNAGRDTTVCAGSPVILGGTPTAHGGTAPYIYRWTPNAGLSCDTCANPVITTGNIGIYSLTVIDHAGDTAKATIHVTVNALPRVSITASDTVVCNGQQIYLQGIGNVVPVCGLTGACNGTSTSATVGNGTTLQSGSAISYPSIFGNYQQSCRQQILYKATELTQVLGGAKTIKGVGFIVGQFNSNAYLQNFTIKIGCTSSDSLIDWNNNLITVTNPTDIQPGDGWNDFAFNSGFFWDGFSNIIIELCWNNPGLFGSQLNKALCTNTTFSSYIYSAGTTDQCSSTTIPTNSNLRPNIEFGYCDAPPPVFTYQWKGNSGHDSIFTPTIANTYANIFNPVTFNLSVKDNNGCVAKDSIHISVRPVSVTTDLYITNASCAVQANGVIIAVLHSQDSVHYQLLNSNYTATLYSGTSANGDTLGLKNLPAGIYHLLLSDSICTNMDDTIIIKNGLLLASETIINPACPSLNNGAIQGILFSNNDSAFYKLLNFNLATILDSGRLQNGDTLNITSLVGGTYTLILGDSLCSITKHIVLQPPSQPNYIGNTFSIICPGDSSTSGCINITGGTSPFNYAWSNAAITGGCPVSVPAGNYSVTVSDANNCVDVISNIVVRQDPDIIVRKIADLQGASTYQVTITISGGTPPYYVIWADGGSLQTSDTATHVYTIASTHQITVQDGIGCMIFDTIVSSFTNGLASVTNSSVKIFPNPATDQLFIESAESQIGAIEVIDITGKLVINENLEGNHQIILDISTLSEGIYVLTAKSQGREYHNRFVKGK